MQQVAVTMVEEKEGRENRESGITLAQAHFGSNNGLSETDGLAIAAQLLKKQANGFNPPVEIGNMKLLIGRVQIVIRQTEAHHHAGNLQHILKIRNDRNGTARSNKNRVLMKDFMHGLSCGLDVFVVRAYHAGWSLTPDLNLGLDPLGRQLFHVVGVSLENVIRILIRNQSHGNFCRRLRGNHGLRSGRGETARHAMHL